MFARRGQPEPDILEAQPNQLRTPEGAGEADEQESPVAQRAQIFGQRR
jgi:hypothetical protein